MRELCRRFPNPFWRDIDAQRAFPAEFVEALTEAGYLAAVVPEDYGRFGPGITRVRDHSRRGQSARVQLRRLPCADVHDGTILRHGSEEQKGQYLPQIAGGVLLLQAFGVSEPTTGSDTTQLKTTAVQKRRQAHRKRSEDLGLSCRALRSHASDRANHTDRSSEKRSDGLSIFIVDLRVAVGHGLTIRPIRTK